MFLPSRVAAVIPCHNEALTVSTLVAEIREHVSHVIVVDDGSSDDTSEKARRAGAEIICSPSAQGKGAALTRGWKRALESGFQSALTLDGDGQHSPRDIPQFLSAAAKAPLVIGNRMHAAQKIPPLRRFVNRWMSQQLSRIAGREMPDTQCGFRLIDLKIWSGLNLQTTHFEIESELLLAFVAAGHPVEFVPIEVIYRQERSKIRPLRDSIRWAQWFRKISNVRPSTSTEPKVGEPVVCQKNAVAP